MIKNLLAKLFSEHLMPDYEAHKRAAQMNTSANEVHLRTELKKYKERATTAEKRVAMFSEMSNEIIKLAMEVPNGEMTPFVHQAVVEVEQRMRYL